MSMKLSKSMPVPFLLSFRRRARGGLFQRVQEGLGVSLVEAVGWRGSIVLE